MYIVMGYDTDEDLAYRVAMASLQAVTLGDPHCVVPISHVSDYAIALGFNRPYRKTGRQYFDIRDKKTFTTEFSYARFLIGAMKWPDYVRWVMFCDGDVMFRRDPAELLEDLDNSKAVYCIQHTEVETESTKMGGLETGHYLRKNWSSVMLWNVKHDMVKNLTVHDVNTMTGAELHRLQWVDNQYIGKLDLSWNFIPGLYREAHCKNPALVHFSRGVPTYEGHETDLHNEEWFSYAHVACRKDQDDMVRSAYARRLAAYKPATPVIIEPPPVPEVACEPMQERSMEWHTANHKCDHRCIEQSCAVVIDKDWEADNIPF